MRLINADELLERMKTIENFSNQKGMFAVAQKMIENAPTVDPIKHGHWTDRAKSILGLPTEACSECAEWSVGHNKDYCPNCGAKMDEVNDGT